MRRSALCVVLLLAACGGSKPAPATRPTASPSPSGNTATVMVYEHERPPSLELPYMRILDAKEANLRWPATGLHLEMIGAAQIVDPLVGSPAPAKPTGQEYVVAYVGRAPSGFSSRRFTDAVVKVDGVPRTVPPFDSRSFIVVAAPEHSVVRLELTDTERMQWIDLRTAEVGNVIAGYDPRKSGNTSIACDFASPDKTVNGSTLVLITRATLEPWVEGRGWAKSGRIWLDVKMQLWYSRNAVAFSLDGATSVTLRGPEGPIPVSLPLGFGGATEDDPHTGQWELIADVPVGITVAQLAFQPKGTIATKGTPVPKWKADCETVSDALNFQ